eukprot:415061-Pyramimonas_sp.AAC.1
MPPKEEDPDWGNDDQAQEQKLCLAETQSEVHPVSLPSDSDTVEEHQAKTSPRSERRTSPEHDPRSADQRAAHAPAVPIA